MHSIIYVYIMRWSTYVPHIHAFIVICVHTYILYHTLVMYVCKIRVLFTAFMFFRSYIITIP